MSFGSRLKELREIHGMKQQELATALGVKNTAISNYELGISSPKEEIMFKIFEFFNVTPNYMFQDEINIKIEEYSSIERNLIKKYRSLDSYGKKLISTVIDMECSRCIDDGMYYRAASSVDNHPAEIVSLSDEERERLAAAHPVTSEDSDL